MSKIGISYITYNRPALWKFGFERFIKTIEPHTKNHDIHVSISDDASESVDVIREIADNIISPICKCSFTTGKLANISWNRNRSLSKLIDCDYIFFFEDDIYPINVDWLEGYLSVLSEPNFEHLQYLPSSIFPTDVYFTSINNKTIMQNQQCSGIMLAITRNVFSKVGGFFHEFGPYGFEHADFTERCNKAQNLPWNLYLTIKEAEDEHWFVSADEFNHTSFSADLTADQFRQINRGSIGQRLDVNDIKKSVSKNEKVWQKSKQMTRKGNLYRDIKWNE